MNTTQSPLPDKEQMRTLLSDELHISHLPKTEQDTILHAFSSMLTERITMNLMLQVPREEYKKIDALIQANQHTDVGALLHKHVPNAEKIISETIINTIAEFIALTKEKK